MECKVDEDMIQQYLEGELGRLESIIMEEHLKECKKCRKELTEMKLLMFELEGLGEVAVPDEAEKVRRKVIDSISHSPDSGPFSIKKMMDIQKAILKSSSLYIKFIPGTHLIESGIKKVPSLFQKAESLAFSRGKKLLMARARV